MNLQVHRVLMKAFAWKSFVLQFRSKLVNGIFGPRIYRKRMSTEKYWTSLLRCITALFICYYLLILNNYNLQRNNRNSIHNCEMRYIKKQQNYQIT